MRRVLLCCAAVAVALLGAGGATADDDAAFQAALDAAIAVDPGIQVANDPGRDIAVGGGTTVLGYRFSFGASSDPLGQDPRGHARVTFPNGVVREGRVSCLTVVSVGGVGTAVIGVGTLEAGTGLAIEAVDGGPAGPDSISVGVVPDLNVCSVSGAEGPQALEHGQIKVRNAVTE